MRLIAGLEYRLKRAFTKRIDFKKLVRQDHVYLYAGDVPEDSHYQRYVGLSLFRENLRHIRHDVRERMPLPDACVDVYQSEDVFEHIDPALLPAMITEIWRILKPGGIFRLSVPDYRCDLLSKRTLRDADGNMVFDPDGGGNYANGKVTDAGHVWLPVYESVRAIIQKTPFTQVTFYHYYDESGRPVTNEIDYSIGYVTRTPDHDDRVQAPYRPLSIVVDCRK